VEAWGPPAAGDEVTPRGRDNASQSQPTISEALRTTLYNPPVNEEQLAVKLKISLVGANPVLTKPAFTQRSFTYTLSLSL
jgi:hypothetical protein